MDFAERLKILVRRYPSNKEFARLTGLTEQRVSDLIHGDAEHPHRKTLNAIVKGTGCCVEWLENSTGPMFPVKEIIQAGAATPGRYIPNAERTEALPSPLPKDLDLVRVVGDSLGEVARDGQWLEVSPTEPRSGSIALIEMLEGELLVKRVTFGKVGETEIIIATPINHDPAFEPRVIERRNVRSLRTVVGVRF